MKLAHVLCALVLVALASGCQSHPVRELAAINESATFRACECFTELGFETESECRAAADMANEAQLVCAEEVYDRFAGSVEPTFDCTIVAARGLESCFLRTSSCDTAALNACLQTYQQEVADCPPLPSAASEAFGTCRR